MPNDESRGYGLVELLLVCGLLATLSGMAIPELRTALDDYQTAGAARYLSARLQQTRMEAVKRSTDVAMRFVQTAEGFTYAVMWTATGMAFERRTSIAGSIGSSVRPNGCRISSPVSMSVCWRTSRGSTGDHHPEPIR